VIDVVVVVVLMIIAIITLVIIVRAGNRVARDVLYNEDEVFKLHEQVHFV
jgi:hypothetical protein